MFTAPVFTLGAAITGALTALPKELIAAIAGLALLGTIGSALALFVQQYGQSRFPHPPFA